MIISNSFFVQVIEDGSALRGEIRSTQPLTQAYSDGTCVPNWAAGVNQPTVYVVLQNGGSWITPDAGYKWYYNGNEIVFDGNGKSLAVANLPAGTFEKVTNYTPDMYEQGQYVPAIKIVKNVASSSNVDIDVLRFDGTKTLTTNSIPFSASLDITITELIKGGYVGMIYLNGSTDKDISSKNDTVKLIAHLYDSEGNEMTPATNGAKYRWLINGVEKVPLGSTNTLVVTESDVYDYAVVSCEFYMPKDNGSGTNVDTLVSTDYLEIDDTQDPQEMYFAYNGANGKAASLRKDESVAFSIWVGDAGNPSASNVDTSFTDWKIILVDSNKQTLMQSLSSYDASINDVIEGDLQGYRPMNSQNGVATITIPFDVAALTAGGQSTSGGIRGYVTAQTSNS